MISRWTIRFVAWTKKKPSSVTAFWYAFTKWPVAPVAWVHANKADKLTNAVDSMPRRLQKAIDLKGAGTSLTDRNEHGRNPRRTGGA